MDNDDGILEEIACLQCKRKQVNNIKLILSCKHLVCDYCYWRIIILGHFDSLINIVYANVNVDSNGNSTEEPALRIHCKCNNGEGVIKLQTYLNYFLKFIEDKEKYKCTVHPSTTAEIYCNQCNHHICGNCFKDSECQNHSYYPNEIYSKCLNHNANDINRYCENCKCAICKVCQALEHSQHQVTVYDTEDERAQTMKSCQYETYKQIDDKLSLLHNKAIKGYKRVMNSKLSHIDDLIGKLNEIKTSMISKMNTKAHQIASFIQVLKVTYKNMFLDKDIDLNQLVSMKKHLKRFLYDITITPESNEELNQISNRIKSLSLSPNTVPTFKYQFIIKKNEMTCIDENKFKDNKITTMATITEDKVAIAFSSALWIYHCCKHTLSDNQYQHEAEINAILVLSKTILATASNDKSIRLWDIKAGAEIFRFLGHFSEVTCLTLIKPSIFASAGNDSMIKIWNIATHKEELSLFDHDSQNINSIVYLTNSRIASAGESEKICIWNYQKDEDLIILYGHVDTITKIILLRDKRIASCSLDKTIKIWKDKICQVSLEGHKDGVLIIYQLKDNRIISGSMDQTCRVWDIYGNQCEIEIKAHSDYINSIVELVITKGNHNNNHNDKKFILTAGYDYALKLWK